MKTQAIVWAGPRVVEFAEVDLPALGPTSLTVDVAFSLISPGTERGWLSSDEAHIVLGTTFPFVPGYSLSGIVTAVGSDVTRFEPGDRVVGSPITGAHAAVAVVDESNAFHVPDGVSLDSAVYFNLGMTAAHTVWASDLRLGESIAIVGQGPIGQFATQIAVAYGAHPIVALEVEHSRLQVAIEAGATYAFDPTDPAQWESFLAATAGGTQRSVDLSGSPRGLRTAIQATSALGTVVLSTGLNADLEIPYGEVFIKALTLKGAFVNARPIQSSRDTENFLDLVARGAVRTPDVEQSLFSPIDASAVYDRILDGTSVEAAPVFDWRTI